MPQQRLELTWIGKGEEPQLEPRILIEDPDKSYGETGSENMLIHGDNLLALKALEQEYAGKVKCVFIDPPYNTGSAFEQYDDGLEHSTWLSLIHQRLNLLSNLLSEDGSIWISIDDHEAHYLKVLCDEIFERSNFIANVIWQKRTSPDNRLRLGGAHDHVLVYGKQPLKHKEFNQLPVSEKRQKAFKNPDKDPRGPWASTDCTAQAGHGVASQFYQLITPAGRVIDLPSNLCWRYNQEKMESEIAAGKIWFGKDGKGVPRKKTYLSKIKGQNAWTWWSNSEVGHNQEAKKEIKAIFGNNNSFDTPKPERLLERVMTLATNPGDLVLDSFLGSGTTAAVAHKMGRRWIGIELGDHANTHCLPRLQKVVDGLDEGGITKAQEWQGGGGFKFYNLAPSLLRKDDLGQWVIDECYNADQLAAAMAKHEGYTYRPDADHYWKQAFSTENDYLFTTTQLVTPAVVDHLTEQLGENESLLICCKAYKKEAAERDPRINLHKIPAMLTDRCEFGKDDYSLNIIDAPKDEDAPDFVPAAQAAAAEAEAEELRKYGKQKDMFD